MRLAALAVGLLLLPVARAHADPIPGLALPDVPLPAYGASETAQDAIASPPSVVLPAETGAALLVPQPTAVTPEPSSVVLMGSGLIGFGGAVWRRRRLSRRGAGSVA